MMGCIIREGDFTQYPTPSLPCSEMVRASRSRATAQVETSAEDPPDDPSTRNPPPPRRNGPTATEIADNARQMGARRPPKCKKGDRYKVPGTEFDRRTTLPERLRPDPGNNPDDSSGSDEDLDAADDIIIGRSPFCHDSLLSWFLWGEKEKKSRAELQEAIALALINNKLLEEADQDADPDNENDLPDFYNDPEDCKKHPDYKTNLCRVCYKHNTVYICDKCSVPTEKKLRKEKGKQGRAKYTQGGFMHFCRHGGCFDKHNCGHVPKRRSKEQMQKDRACD